MIWGETRSNSTVHGDIEGILYMVRLFRINKVYHKEKSISNRFVVNSPFHVCQRVTADHIYRFPCVERVMDPCGVERQECIVARAF